ncbi:MAG: serine/threonine-protein kinase, partial [Planctomycetota bacterium]|nr:serine/threonine-protein kinase [Planctomycetota bacterium]
MTANETFDQFDRHRQAHELRERFESAWRAGQQPQLEHYLNEFAADGCEILLTDLLGVELELRLAEGAPPQLDEYRRRFPQHGALVDQVFAEVLATTEASGQGGLRAGMRLGEFRILREVGRGGMGVIYEAVQETLGRTVALKVLSPLLAATPERVRRFAREARVVAHLHHTNIVEVYGTGGSDGWRYMAMQFVPGQGLDRILQNECLRSDCPYRRGSVEAVRPAVPALPWGPTMADRCRTVARVGQQIASALAYAHGRAVLHHDVKPSNILLDPQGTAWLTDFGLARLMETESVAAEHGHVAGTLRYMAPEVFDGQGDERSDVYGLGLTLYELLSGCDRCREAGESEGESSPQAIVHRARPRLELTRPEASRDLVTIVHKAIDQEPARRYDSAGELAADLERFLRDEPIRARRVGPAERGAWWCRKNPGFASLSCGALLLLLLGTSLSLWAAAHFRRQEAQQRLLVIAGQQLAVRNAGLAAENAVARDQAQAAQRQAQLTLADMFTAHGLQASDNGQDREALLWFAHAASIYEELETERTPRDVGLRPEPPQTSSDEAAGAAQLRASVNRVRLGARRLARPVAVFRNQALVDRLFIHPSQRYVLMRPFLGWPGALWDAQTEQPVVLPPAATPAQALAWTPDGQRLAVGQWDKVTLFQFPELTEPQEIPCGLAVRAGPGAAGMAGSESQLTANAVGSDGQPALVQRLEFDASGRYLAIASYRAVRIWDGERQDFTGPPWPHPAPIQCLVFSSDSRYLVTGAADDRFRLFAVTASQTAPTCEGPHRTNTTWTFVAPRFTEDSRHLVTRAEKEKLGVWEVDARQLAREIPSPVGVIYCLEPISTDGELLVGGTNGLAVVHPRHDVERPPLTTLATVVAAFDPRQQLALVGRGVRECQLWSLPEWRQQPCPAVHPEGCRSVAFSADGRCFVTAGYDHNVRLWAMPQPD